VTLNRDVMDLYVGDTGQLKATVTPEDATDKSVTWQSSDNAVATVDAGGLVTARSSGSAYIRVYTKDLGFTAACRVRVTLFIAVEKVTVVDIQQRDTSRIAVGKTLQLYANVEPYDATEQTVTWTSSDEEVATVDGNGQVTTLKAGTVRITATAGGKSGFYQLTVADSGNENFNQGGSLGWD
jgi:alpha-L-fucosidase 2